MGQLGIIAALPAEAECLYQGKLEIGVPVEIDTGLFLCLSGIGHELATRSTIRLLNLNLDALISWGIAGAINTSLQSGDLLIAEAVIEDDHHYPVSVNWLNKIKTSSVKSSFNTVTGTLISMPGICASIEDKYNLYKKTAAWAVDMESAAIAKQALDNNIDFIAIRAVADTANSTIPAIVIDNTDKLGKPDIVRFVYSGMKNPGQIGDLIRLRAAYKKALKTLQQIAPDLKKHYFSYTA